MFNKISAVVISSSWLVTIAILVNGEINQPEVYSYDDPRLTCQSIIFEDEEFIRCPGEPGHSYSYMFEMTIVNPNLEMQH